MVWWLRALAACAEDLSVVTVATIRQLETAGTWSSRDLMLFSGLHGHPLPHVHVHTDRHIHTHEIKIKTNFLIYEKKG